jgi:hypothetical protein
MTAHKTRKGTTATTTAVPDAFKGLSIQGESAARRAAAVWATDSEAADYTRAQPDGVVACRERGRHQYPPTRLTLTGGPPFIDITPEGFYVREIPCESCRHVNDDGTPGLPRVVRREVWDVKHKRGVIVEGGAQLISAKPQEVDPDYLNGKGQGRIKPRQVRKAVMSSALVGQNIRTLRQQIIDERDERARLITEAYERAQAAQAADTERATLAAVPDAG